MTDNLFAPLRRFYVTAQEGSRTFFLAGPYETYGEAWEKVDRVRDMACDPEVNSSYGRAAFMGYGVTRGAERLKTALGII